MIPCIPRPAGCLCQRLHPHRERTGNARGRYCGPAILETDDPSPSRTRSMNTFPDRISTPTKHTARETYECGFPSNRFVSRGSLLSPRESLNKFPCAHVKSALTTTTSASWDVPSARVIPAAVPSGETLTCETGQEKWNCAELLRAMVTRDSTTYARSERSAGETGEWSSQQVKKRPAEFSAMVCHQPPPKTHLMKSTPRIPNPLDGLCPLEQAIRSRRIERR